MKATTNETTLYNVLSTVILQGLTFITAPIISRLLGTANYGVVSVYSTWVAVLVIVFGLQTHSTIAVSRTEFVSEEEQQKYQSSILSISFISFLCFSALATICINLVSTLLNMTRVTILLMLFQAFGQFCVTFINTKWTYEFKAKYNFWLSIAVAASTLVLSIVLIKEFPTSNNYYGRMMGMTIPYVTIGLGLAISVWKKGKVFYNSQYWKYCLVLCVPIIFHGLSGIVLNQCDRIMLRSMISDSSAGIYSLSCSFAAVISTIWGALNNSWVPYYYDYTKDRNFKELKIRSKNYLELFTILVIGFVLLAPEVYHLFAGKEYWNGTSFISLLAVGYYFVFMYSFPVNYEFYNKKTKTIALGTVLAAIINIILNYLLIKAMGSIGAVVATVLAHFFQFIFHQIVATFLVKGDSIYPYKLKMLLPYAAIVIFVAILSLFNFWWGFRWSIGFILGILELVRIIKRKVIF